MSPLANGPNSDASTRSIGEEETRKEEARRVAEAELEEARQQSQGEKEEAEADREVSKLCGSCVAFQRRCPEADRNVCFPCVSEMHDAAASLAVRERGAGRSPANSA